MSSSPGGADLPEAGPVTMQPGASDGAPEPSCALCGEVVYASVPLMTPTRFDVPRPDIWLCLSHWREVVAGYTRLGWCAAGSHAGVRLSICDRHGAVFLE